jgi:hypothetical protein
LGSGCGKTQATGRVPSSAANPLPTVFYGPEIPLSAGSGNSVQIIELRYVFDHEERILGAEKRFFPLPAGEWRWSQIIATARRASSISAFAPAPPPAR